jgi:hypothetical protein
MGMFTGFMREGGKNQNQNDVNAKPRLNTVIKRLEDSRS